jgi:hypothetical protein
VAYLEHGDEKHVFFLVPFIQEKTKQLQEVRKVCEYLRDSIAKTEREINEVQCHAAALNDLY